MRQSQCKEARTESDLQNLFTRTPCRTEDETSEETYEHLFHKCLHSFLLKGRTELDTLLD